MSDQGWDDLEDDAAPSLVLSIPWEAVTASLNGVSTTPETHAPDAPELTQTGANVLGALSDPDPETTLPETGLVDEEDPEITAFIEAIESLDEASTNEDEDGLTLFGSNDDFRLAWQEWKGMPEFSQKNLAPYRSITIHFASPEDVETFGVLLDQKPPPITSSRGLWFPKPDVAHFVDKRYRTVEEEEAHE
jgi:hypothetical protein